MAAGDLEVFSGEGLGRRELGSVLERGLGGKDFDRNRWEGRCVEKGLRRLSRWLESRWCFCVVVGMDGWVWMSCSEFASSNLHSGGLGRSWFFRAVFSRLRVEIMLVRRLISWSAPSRASCFKEAALRRLVAILWRS